MNEKAMKRESCLLWLSNVIMTLSSGSAGLLYIAEIQCATDNISRIVTRTQSC